MSSRRQKLLVRVNWYIQSSLKHITELITGNKFYYRGGRYRQVSLYHVLYPYGVIDNKSVVTWSELKASVFIYWLHCTEDKAKIEKLKSE